LRRVSRRRWYHRWQPCIAFRPSIRLRTCLKPFIAVLSATDMYSTRAVFDRQLKSRNYLHKEF
jgi:hypothetical protein